MGAVEMPGDDLGRIHRHAEFFVDLSYHEYRMLRYGRSDAVLPVF